MFLLPSSLLSVIDVDFTLGNPDDSRKRGRWVLAFGFALLMGCGWCQGALAQAAQTTTALALTSGGSAVTTVAAGSVVTLTATVMAGATAVTTGQVNFCDASAPYCTDIHLLGSAALTSAGAAAFKFAPGTGVHSYKAVFLANVNGLGSSSAATDLTVGPAKSPVYSDTTAITTNNGQPGDYSLTAAVVGYGGTTPPTGNVSFVDTSFGNTTLGTAALGASTPGMGWLVSQTAALSNSSLSEVAGDFNGDGIPDLALLWTNSSTNTSEVTVFLGKGDGTFSTQQTTQATVTGQPYSGMVAGDFNGDGKLDLVLLYCNGGSASGSATGFLGNGDGTFAVSPTSSTFSYCPSYGLGFVPGTVVAADLNGDGKLDVALAGNNGSSSEAIALLGNGDGTFSVKTSSGPASQTFNSVVVGDFNGDGIPDLIVANYLGATTATVFLGKGDGTFTPLATQLTVSSSSSEFVYSMAAGDFNGDGKLDLAISEAYGEVIFLGNGDGTFTQTSGSPIAVSGTDLYSLTVGDFNQDGKPDLAGVDTYDGKIVVLAGAGDGTFTVTSTTPTLVPGPYIIAADFNGDGAPDLAMLPTGRDTASILLNVPTETATATVNGLAPVGAGTHNVEANYAGNSNYPASVSATAALSAGLAPLVFSPAPGTYTAGQTITISEPIPGAAIYYVASGAVNTNGYVPYTGPIQLTVGGSESIIAYATETGYQQSNYVGAVYTINLPIAPSPQLSLAAGYYPGTQTVTITDAVAGASIYYTTNGQPPTLSSTLYSGPITVSSSETLTAVVITAGYDPSPVTTAQYTIGSSSAPFIYTMAGTGFQGYTGDSGAATSAEIDFPMAAVKDAAGNIYIADLDNYVVRKVAAGTGVISTIAGNGTSGYSGNRGPATSAMLRAPTALALDALGNLFIVDGYVTVREVNLASGIISTYAGNFTGTNYVSGGQAAAMNIAEIFGIAIDASRNVYLSSSNAVLKVTDSTGIITTIAGSTNNPGYGGDNGPASAALFDNPQGLALDASGNLYIADEYNDAVRKITAVGGVITPSSIVTTAAGVPKHWAYAGAGGPATSTPLDYPAEVAVDGSNNLYISDIGTDLIWQLSASTGNLTRIIGSGTGSCTTYGGDGGPAASASVCNPYGVSVDSAGDLIIADTWDDRVREIFAAAAPPTTQAAAPTFSLASGTYPAAQRVTLSDSTPGASIYLTVDGSTPTTVSNGYSFPLNIAGAITIKAVAAAPGYLTSEPASASYAVTAFEPVISTIAGNGTAGESGSGYIPSETLAELGAGGPAANVEFALAQDAAINKAGDVFVSDSSNNIVWKFAAGTGIATVVAGTGTSGTASSGILAVDATLNGPQGLAVDSAGNLYIADVNNYVVREVNAATGIITTVAGSRYVPPTIPSGDGGPATAAFVSPNALAIDGANNLYIADNTYYEIRKVSAQTGIITAVAGNGTYAFSGDGGLATQAGLDYINALAVSASGDIYFSSLDTRVRKVTASTGIISTVAGYSGNVGEKGDGGPAINAQLYINGLALDSGGDIFISVYPAGIREVNATTGTISRVAGIGYAGFSGDSGPALIAELRFPNGIVFDSAGNLILVDQDNYRVRKISFAPQTTATPLISLPTATYTSVQSVTITDATAGSTIYYTVDGTTPTSGSTAYSGAIKVSSSETLSAIAEAVGYSPSAVASATYTIKLPAAPSITLASSAALAFVSNPVTFTATLTATAGTPTGTVSFYDGATLLGPGTVSAAAATYTTSSLAAGSHSITAVYSGDTNFAPVTSSAVTETIENFTVGVGSGSSSVTASPGGQAVYTFAVTPPAGNVFAGPITFAVTGLPSGGTATFSPSSLAAGAGATNVTMTVSVPATAEARPLPRPFGGGALPLALGLILLPFAGRMKRASRRLNRMGCVLVLGVVGLAFAFGITACGGGGSGTKTTSPQPRTYTLTVAANSGALSNTFNVTLVVQ